MALSRIVDHDPIQNITSYWMDNGDGTETTWEEQDITALLEYNQSIRRTTKRRDRWGPGKHVAELPMSVLMQLRRDGILDDPPAFLRWLQKEENRPFAVAEFGRLI